MCLTTRALVSRPLASALDSAFFRSCRRNSADLTGQRARETPHCLPVHHISVSLMFICDDSRKLFDFLDAQMALGRNVLRPRASQLFASSIRRRYPAAPPFLECPMSPVTACLRYCRIVRTLRSTADGASVAAEGDDLLLLLDVLKELDGALQLPAVDGLGGLAGVLKRNSEVGTAGLGRLGGRDLGGSVANLWVERVNVTISAAASPMRSFPLPPVATLSCPRFPQGFGSLGRWGQSAIRSSWASEIGVHSPS